MAATGRVSVKVEDVDDDEDNYEIIMVKEEEEEEEEEDEEKTDSDEDLVAPPMAPPSLPTPSPSTDHGLEAPHSREIAAVLEESRWTPMSNQEKPRGRPKRRRVTSATAARIGMRNAVSLHANNAKRSHASCVKEQKGLADVMRRGMPKDAAAGERTTAPTPQVRVRSLSDLSLLRAIDDLGMDKASVSASILSRWEKMTEADRADAAMYGIQLGSAKAGNTPASATAAASPSAADVKMQENDTAATAAETEEPLHTADWCMTLTLERLLSDLKPTYMKQTSDNQDKFDGASTTLLLQDLIDKSARLEVMKASTASLLLRQSGPWFVPKGRSQVQRDFPACSRGAECCGMTVTFMSKFVGTPTAWMSQAEYDRFVNDAVLPHGIQDRICILCYRMLINRFMVIVRKNKTRVSNVPVAMQYWSIEMDVPGGYSSEACIKPVDSESCGVPFNGFVCPFVGFRITDYTIRHEQGRLIWDQSAIVLPEEVGSSEPLYGQRMSSFLERVMLEQRLSGKIDLEYTRRMIHKLHPVVCLARDYPALFIEIFPWTADSTLEDIGTHFLVPLSEERMKASLGRLEAAIARLGDMPTERKMPEWCTLKGVLHLFADVRFADQYAQHAGKPLSETLRVHLRSMAPNIFSLGLNIHKHLRQCVFWSEEPPGVPTNTVKLLNKSLPQPCLIRMFPDMLNGFVADTNNGHVFVNNIIFLSLLGSYYVTPSRYMKCVVQRNADGATTATTWQPDNKSLRDDQVFALRCIHFERPDIISSVYVQTPTVALACVRALVYVVLRNDRTFYNELEDTVNISYVENVINSYMVFYRRVIGEQLPSDRWLACLRDNSNELWNQSLQDLRAQMKEVAMSPMHRELKKSKLNHLNAAMRNTMCRLVPHDILDEMRGVIEKADELHILCTKRRCRPPAILTIHTSKWDEAPELPKEIHQVMDEWMQYVGDRTIDPMKLAQGLYHFPVNKTGLSHILQSLRSFDMLQMNDRGLRDLLHGPQSTKQATRSRKVVPLFRRWPNTMAIVRLFAQTYAVRRSCATFALPYHIIMAQMDAVRRRWTLRPEEPIPMHDSYLLWCRVCHYIYSILKSVPNREKGVKSHKTRAVAAGGAVGMRDKRDKAMASTRRKAKDQKSSGASQRRMRVSQRTGTDKRRVANSTWSTRTSILEAYHVYSNSTEMQHDDVEHIRSLGTAACNGFIDRSMRSIKHYRSLGNDVAARSANHLTNACHGFLEAVMHLKDLAGIMRGQRQESKGNLPTAKEIAMWECDARNLNMLCMTADAIGPDTNTTGSPHSLRGANCKTQTGTGYGHWCSLSDLISGQQFCHVGHNQGGKWCIDQPLTRTLIMGQIVCIGRRAVMLCGSCGGCFVLYANMYCMFTERGYVCQHCTSFIRRQRTMFRQAQGLRWEIRSHANDMLPLAVTPEEKARREEDAKQPSPKCVKCGNVIARKYEHLHGARVYRFGILVCYRDSYGLNVYISSRQAEFDAMDEKTYLAALLKAIDKVRSATKRWSAASSRVASGKRISDKRDLSTTELFRGKGLADAFIKRTQERRATQLQAQNSKPKPKSKSKPKPKSTQDAKTDVKRKSSDTEADGDHSAGGETTDAYEYDEDGF